MNKITKLLAVLLIVIASIVLLGNGPGDHNVFAPLVFSTRPTVRIPAGSFYHADPFIVKDDFRTRNSTATMILTGTGNFGTGLLTGTMIFTGQMVYVDAFEIDVYETTNAEYRQCMDAGVCDEPGKISNADLQESSYRPNYLYNPTYDNYPVLSITPELAETYCNWRGKRLPTDLEWEKAARGPEGFLYPWGDEPHLSPWLNGLDSELSCSLVVAQWQNNKPYGYWPNAQPDNCSWIGEMGSRTTGSMAVGSRPDGVSGYGVHDMIGNASEITTDSFRGGSYTNVVGGYVAYAPWPFPQPELITDLSRLSTVSTLPISRTHYGGPNDEMVYLHHDIYSTGVRCVK